jgi:hypothetical protein
MKKVFVAAQATESRYPSGTASMVPRHGRAGAQHDLDLAGVAKTSREERIKGRRTEHAH